MARSSCSTASPGSGATLAVRDGCVAGLVARTCTESWRGAFDVLVDLEMANAVLTVRFYDGDTLCGYAANTLNPVPANSRVTIEVGTIFLSDEFRTFRTPCRRPFTTNRIEAELWSDSSAWGSRTLVQLFPGSYTFADR